MEVPDATENNISNGPIDFTSPGDTVPESASRHTSESMHRITSAASAASAFQQPDKASQPRTLELPVTPTSDEINDPVQENASLRQVAEVSPDQVPSSGEVTTKMNANDFGTTEEIGSDTSQSHRAEDVMHRAGALRHATDAFQSTKTHDSQEKEGFERGEELSPQPDGHNVSGSKRPSYASNQSQPTVDVIDRTGAESKRPSNASIRSQLSPESIDKNVAGSKRPSNASIRSQHAAEPRQSSGSKSLSDASKYSSVENPQELSPQPDGHNVSGSKRPSYASNQSQPTVDVIDRTGAESERPSNASIRSQLSPESIDKNVAGSKRPSNASIRSQHAAEPRQSSGSKSLSDASKYSSVENPQETGRPLEKSSVEPLPVEQGNDETSPILQTQLDDLSNGELTSSKVSKIRENLDDLHKYLLEKANTFQPMYFPTLQEQSNRTQREEKENFDFPPELSSLIQESWKPPDPRTQKQDNMGDMTLAQARNILGGPKSVKPTSASTTGSSRTRSSRRSTASAVQYQPSALPAERMKSALSILTSQIAR